MTKFELNRQHPWSLLDSLSLLTYTIFLLRHGPLIVRFSNESTFFSTRGYSILFFDTRLAFRVWKDV